ncbi:sporulation protein YyaC [Paenibacillus curdlanolyticus YK9]|uniref:Sporulation protein YyaC n=1 Tax=Paenibacillus curdlanolyticus YK9 TaxID=717606 RepID=E0I9U1_9BACL|nr:spore protease YyaC [Paenibacillus curdlanolyticus]EFM10518.1 sporulation protein YyaC [Paenibacillus curdlanolyticus YK9]
MGLRRRRQQVKPVEKKVSVTVDAQGIQTFLSGVAAKRQQGASIRFVCIGTDQSTGDAFGPLVGSMLKEYGWADVIGTLDRPLDAKQIAVQQISPREGTITITIDACLGKADSVGKYAVSEGPLRPGEGVGLKLDPIGDYAIAGVVNELGPKPYRTLQATSLYLVMEMAREAAGAIDRALRCQADGDSLANHKEELR